MGDEGERGPLADEACWFAGLLACWFAGLLACCTACPVGLLACRPWALGLGRRLYYKWKEGPGPSDSCPPLLRISSSLGPFETACCRPLTVCNLLRPRLWTTETRFREKNGTVLEQGTPESPG